MRAARSPSANGRPTSAACGRSRVEWRSSTSHPWRRRTRLVVEGFDPSVGGEERRGPAEAVAFSDGRPTKAAEGFARGLGLGVDELTVRGGYLWGRAAPPPLEERLWQLV